MFSDAIHYNIMYGIYINKNTCKQEVLLYYLI